MDVQRTCAVIPELFAQIVMLFKQPIEEAFHPPLSHGFAGVLPGDEPALELAGALKSKHVQIRIHVCIHR
jgi:hypothetical protein